MAHAVPFGVGASVRLAVGDDGDSDDSDSDDSDSDDSDSDDGDPSCVDPSGLACQTLPDLWIYPSGCHTTAITEDDQIPIQAGFAFLASDLLHTGGALSNGHTPLLQIMELADGHSDEDYRFRLR